VRWLFSILAISTLGLLACRSEPQPDPAVPWGSPAASGTPWVPLSVTPHPTRTPAPPTPEPTPIPRPYRVTFATGATIDVSPAVVFGDLETGAAEGWVFPGAAHEFVVAPAGGFVIFRVAEGFKLLRTEDGTVNSLGIPSWPVALGPGNSGFIATDPDGFLLSAYDGYGHLLQNLWRSSDAQPAVAAWAEDGSIAVGQNLTGTEVAVSVFAAPDLKPAAVGDGFRTAVPDGSGLALEWSPDSEVVAVVTSDAVYGLDRNNELVWSVEGEFVGNPRWSPDGEHLTVFAKPRVVARDGSDAGSVFATYVLNRSGREVLRFSAGGACDGNPWLDATSFVAFSHRVYLDGRVTPYDGPSADRWERVDDLGFLVPTDLGYHYPHIAARYSDHYLDDGRFFFVTGGVGHGGCGEGDQPTEWPAAEVERSPYGPVRAASE